MFRLIVRLFTSMHFGFYGTGYDRKVILCGHLFVKHSFVLNPALSSFSHSSHSRSHACQTDKSMMTFEGTQVGGQQPIMNKLQSVGHNDVFRLNYGL